MPYAFGYMMAAKVGTGFVAEIGSMRISDEIDALEVMGFDAVLYLGSTRLLGTWLVLPFLYMGAVAIGFVASYLAAVVQLGQVSPAATCSCSGSSSRPRTSSCGIKAMAMATFIVLVCIYYGYNVPGRPGRRRQGDGAVDGGEHPRDPSDRDGRDPAVLGRQRHAPISG